MERPKERKTYAIKNLELKDLNDKTGEVVFYFAAFTRDREYDTILKSAYTKTLQENVANIYHNRDHSQACGKPISFGIDEKGAYCVSQLAIKTIVGADTYEQYLAGLVKGHSQEFQVYKSEPDPAGGRIIKELKLWGVTSVTNIPAHGDTPTISVKSVTELADELCKINELLRKGNISDQLGERFCDEYKRLKSLMDGLLKEEQAVEKKTASIINMDLVNNFKL